MNLVIRGVRVIDPSRDVDAVARDVRIEAGVITAIGGAVDDLGLRVLDLTPSAGQAWCVLCPGFIDLHAHLREPGAERGETIATGARAAAAGGFTQVVAMANTSPPIDSPERVRDAVERAKGAAVDVLTVAAATRGLEGEALVEVEECAEQGAVAFSDDGRNAMAESTLVECLRRAAALGRAVLVHPEAEAMLATAPGARAIVRVALRSVDVETAAVEAALRALRTAGTGHLHLQHLSTSHSVDLLTRAKSEGLSVSAEVTPHHLGISAADGGAGDDPMFKVNPPLRAREHREAVLHALRDGVIDCVATDHAPHEAGEKSLPYADAAPGMIGLETALALCITRAEMGGEWLPVLVDRLTRGPYGVMRTTGHVRGPALQTGEAASCVVFDPDEEWVVGEVPMQSRSRNTPLDGARLRGRVLLTIHDGRVVHWSPQLAGLRDPARV